MAEVPTARERGYGAGRFFLQRGRGRCEPCQGDGVVKMEMHFLPDVYGSLRTPGSATTAKPWKMQYKGQNIAQILEMTADVALDFSQAVPAIARKLQTLMDVGRLHPLDQVATTLSGGEAQRVKPGTRTVQAGYRPHPVHMDEPPPGYLCRHRTAAEVLHQLRDAGQHHRRHRTQPRCHQNRRLAHRHGAKAAVAGHRVLGVGTRNLAANPVSHELFTQCLTRPPL